jgi:Holliday junction resolvase
MKPATAKAKGLQCENQMVAWLNEQGYTAERRRLNGALDKGDIAVHGLNICIEVKSGAGPWKMTEWVRQTLAEMKNANAARGILAIRPARPKGMGDWVGVTFDYSYVTHTVNLPQSMPWAQVYPLMKANSYTRFERVLGDNVLTLGMLPKVWETAVEVAGA